MAVRTFAHNHDISRGCWCLVSEIRGEVILSGLLVRRCGSAMDERRMHFSSRDGTLTGKEEMNNFVTTSDQHPNTQKISLRHRTICLALGQLAMEGAVYRCCPFSFPQSAKKAAEVTKAHQKNGVQIVPGKERGFL
jgi:hypothetical protein